MITPIKNRKLRRTGRWALFIGINAAFFAWARYIYLVQDVVGAEQHLNDVICIGVIYIIFLILVGNAIFNISNIKILKKRGVVTIANITKITETSVGGARLSNNVVNIFYNYNVQGELYEKKYSFLKKGFNYGEFYRGNYLTDKKIEVIYDPLKPSRCFFYYLTENYY